MLNHELFIGGRWRASGDKGTKDVLNPATGLPIAKLASSTQADLAEAVETSVQGFALWRRTSSHQRCVIMKKAAQLMRDRASEIGRSMTLEQGKTVREGEAEVRFAADVIEWLAEEGKRAYGRIVPSADPAVIESVHVEPIGPVAAFTPWNFPCTTPARKIGGALGAGCSIILKPSEETPATAIAIARAFQDAGLPDGVLNLVFGDSREISRYLVTHPAIRKVTLTGSVPVGREIARLAAEDLKVVTMELGGHAPVLVFEDADIDQSAVLSAAAKFRNAGQICIAPTRFFVQRGVYDEFSEKFASAVKKLKVGDGMDETSDVGPLANLRRVQATERLVQDAVGRGASVAAGGERIGNSGFFFAPTVLKDVPADALAMTEEPFGPLAVLAPFDSEQEALTRSNELPFGLAAYLFTKDSDRAHRVTRGLESGMVGINHFVVARPELPFTGVKHSGYGSESGQEGLEAYLVKKTVTQRVG